MTFRLIDQKTQYRDNSGNVLAGGLLYFYVNETTTPKTVYLDPDMADEASNPVELDAAGRTDTDVWLDGVYSVALKTSGGSTVWTLDNVRGPDSEATELPALEADKFLTNDGAVMSWEEIRQVPDPTGNAGRYLGTDGEALSWTAFDAAVEYDADNLPGGIEQTTTTWRIGNLLFQVGSDTAPTAGAITTSKAVTFATAYDETPLFFAISVAAQGVTGDTPSAHVSSSYAGLSTTGATAHFFAGAENNGGNTNITSTIAFKYLVVGIKAP